MKALIVGRDIAAGRGRKPRLTVNAHASPIAVAVAARPRESDGKPVIAAAPTIQQERRRPSEIADDNIHPAVIIYIAKSSAACGPWHSHAGIGALEAAMVV